MTQKTERAELLTELHRLDAMTEGAPRLADLREYGRYSKQPFQREFGGWTNALDVAGIRGGKKENISRADLIAELQRLAEELEKTPTRTEMNDHGRYSRSPYERVFGSWNDALAAAGLERHRPHALSEPELRAELKRLAQQLGRTPTMAEMRKHGQYSERPYKDRFGSWNDAVRAVDLPVNKANERLERTCPQCDETFFVKPSRSEERKYCSLSCHASSRTGESNPHPEAGNRITLECEWCGDEYEVYPYEADSSRFCSYDCLGKHNGEVRSGEDSPRYTGGAVNYRGANWPEQRQQALDRDGHECVHCGISQAEHEYEYAEELNIHHIVPFHEFDSYEQANELTNLVTLCTDCHMLYEHLPTERQRKLIGRESVS